MTTRLVKCPLCQGVEEAADFVDGYCSDCTKGFHKAYGWRRFARLLMQGIEPEQDRTSMH
jgi:hypothetical protein